MSRALLEPILDEGLRTTHFFNGRLLSAEDLALEQEGNREARRRLGLALGDGVSFGLEVFQTPGTSTVAAPTVTVRAGLAINRRGHAISLPADADLSLVRRIDPGATEGATFAECQPQQRGVYVTGDGLYVLVISPATARIGRAPVSGLGNVAAGCNSRYRVEGVQFRLVQILANSSVLSDPARLRNRVAHAAFGIRDVAPIAYADPFAQIPGYGLIDELRRTRVLTDCDVPLATLYWTARGGIQFVDLWSVRRRLTKRPVSERWPLFLDDRRVSEAEAAFHQFQEEIDDMLASELDLSAVKVSDRFDYLPPVCIVPIAASGARSGFNEATFFENRFLPHVGTLDGDRLRSLIAESLHHEPIDLTAGDPLQLYVVFENHLAVEQGVIGRRDIVVARETLPFRGTARFAFGVWSRARYGTSR